MRNLRKPRKELLCRSVRSQAFAAWPAWTSDGFQESQRSFRAPSCPGGYDYQLFTTNYYSCIFFVGGLERHAGCFCRCYFGFVLNVSCTSCNTCGICHQSLPSLFSRAAIIIGKVMHPPLFLVPLHDHVCSPSFLLRGQVPMHA